MDYAVYASFRGKVRVYNLCSVKLDDRGHLYNFIAQYSTKQAAMTAARLLAGWSGRVAFTTDPTTYPW